VDRAYSEGVSRVLIVDDDATVAEVVTTYLHREGYDVRHASDGLSALTIATSYVPDLVVLDLMLPGIDGLEVCRRLRAERPGLPVVMLTARGDEEDRVLGLEVGADDYVTKPFSARELVLRIQSVLRRTHGDELATVLPDRLSDDDLTLDTKARVARQGRHDLSLTAREFDLLAHLMAHPGVAFTREQLMDQVWGWEYGDHSTVTVHVRRLREKVEDEPSNPKRLMTVWGVGYRWDPADVVARTGGR
jgi:DNA-binding response OmpR family regulator